MLGRVRAARRPNPEHREIMATKTAPPTSNTPAQAAAAGPPVPREDWTLEELQQEAEDLRGRLSHFSVSQLDVVEAVVRAVVSDDLTLGTQARRWLDDDEFLVRRRIHRDVRTMMAHA